MFTVKAIANDEEIFIHSRINDEIKVKNGTLTESVNTIPTYSFSFYPNNPGYDKLEMIKSKVELYDFRNSETIFIGRVYSITDNMKENGEIYKSVICEGELAYLCDVLIPYVYYSSGTLTNYSLKNIIEMYNERADADKQFSIGTIETTGNYEVIEEHWISAWELLMKFCKIYRGEIRLTYDSDGTRRISFAHEFGSLSEPDIAVSINLKALKRTAEPTHLITRFYPVGGVLSSGKRLTISPYASDKDYIENTTLQNLYGTHEAVKIYDIGDENSTQQEIPHLAHDLISAGEEDFNDTLESVETTFNLSVLDLSYVRDDFKKFRLYNKHRVISKLQNIDDKVRIVKVVLYQDTPWNTALTFGTNAATLTSIIANMT